MYDEAANAEGAAALQAAKTMDSIETKINQMKVAFQEFYTSTGVQDLIKGVIDFITRLINRFNDFTKMWDKFPASALSIIAILITSIKSGSSIVLDLLMNTSGQVKNIIITDLDKAGTIGGKKLAKGISSGLSKQTAKINYSRGGSIFSAVMSLAGSGLTMAGLGEEDDQTSSRMTVLGSTLSGIGTGVSIGAGFGPWGMAAGGIIGGIVGLTSSLKATYKTLNKKVESAEEKLERVKKELETDEQETLISKNEVEELKKYRIALEQAKEKQYESNEAKQEYIDLSNEIASKYGELVTGCSAEGDAVIELGKAYEHLLKIKTLAYQYNLTDSYIKQMSILLDKSTATLSVLDNPFEFANDFTEKNLKPKQGVDVLPIWREKIWDELMMSQAKSKTGLTPYAMSETLIKNTILNSETNESGMEDIFTFFNALGLDFKTQILDAGIAAINDPLKTITQDKFQIPMEILEPSYGKEFYNLGTSMTFLEAFGTGNFSSDLFEARFDPEHNYNSKALSSILSSYIVAIQEEKSSFDVSLNDFFKLFSPDGKINGTEINFGDESITIEIGDLGNDWLKAALDYQGTVNSILEKNEESTRKSYISEMALSELEKSNTNYSDFEKGIYTVLYQEEYLKLLEEAKEQYPDPIEAEKMASLKFQEKIQDFDNFAKASMIHNSNDLISFQKKYDEFSKMTINEYDSFIQEELITAPENLQNAIEEQFSALYNQYIPIIAQIKGYTGRINTFFSDNNPIDEDFYKILSFEDLEKYRSTLSYYNSLLTSDENTEKEVKSIEAYQNLVSNEKTRKTILSNDVTTLLGLIELREDLEEIDASLVGKDSDYQKLIDNYSLNVGIEWDIYRQKVNETMESFSDAVDKAFKGMSLDEALKMSEMLGKDITDFKIVDGKFFYNNIDDIKKAYSKINENYEEALIEATQQEISALLALSDTDVLELEGLINLNTYIEEARGKGVSEENINRAVEAFEAYKNSFVALSEYREQMINIALLDAGLFNEFFSELEKVLGISSLEGLKKAFKVKDPSELIGDEALDAYFMYIDEYSAALGDVSKNLVDSILAFITNGNNSSKWFDVSTLVEAGLFNISGYGQDLVHTTLEGKTFVKLDFSAAEEVFKEQLKSLLTSGEMTLEEYNNAMADFYSSQQKDTNAAFKEFLFSSSDGTSEEEISAFASALRMDVDVFKQAYLDNATHKIDWETLKENDKLDAEVVGKYYRDFIEQTKDDIVDIVETIFESGKVATQSQMDELNKLIDAAEAEDPNAANYTDLRNMLKDGVTGSEYISIINSLTSDDLKALSDARDAVIKKQNENSENAKKELDALAKAETGEKINLTYLSESYKEVLKNFGYILNEDGIYEVSDNADYIGLLDHIMTTGAEDIGYSVEQIADKIQEIFNSWGNAIATGIEGGLTNENARVLIDNSRLGLTEDDFYRAENGLQLTQEAANRVYQTLKETDSISANIVLNALVESAKNADKELEDILYVEKQIAALNEQINKKGISDDRKEALESELEVAKKIHKELLEAGNAFNFMNRDIRSDLTNPLSAWEGMAQALQVIEGEEFKNNRISYQDFSNILYLFETSGAELKNSAGEMITVAELLKEGEKSLSVADGNVFVDLLKFGEEYQTSAEEYKQAIEAGVKSIAQGQLTKLTAQRGLLVDAQITEESATVIKSANDSFVEVLEGDSLELNEAGILIQETFKKLAQYAGLSEKEAEALVSLEGLDQKQANEKFQAFLSVIQLAQTDLEDAIGKLEELRQKYNKATDYSSDGSSSTTLPSQPPVNNSGNVDTGANKDNLYTETMTAKVGTLYVSPNYIKVIPKEGQTEFEANTIEEVKAAVRILTISSTGATYVNNEKLSPIGTANTEVQTLTITGYTYCSYSETGQEIIFGNIVDGQGKFGTLYLTRAEGEYSTIWKDAPLLLEINGVFSAIADLASLTLYHNKNTTKYKDYGLTRISLTDKKASADVSTLTLSGTDKTSVTDETPKTVLSEDNKSLIAEVDNLSLYKDRKGMQILGVDIDDLKMDNNVGQASADVENLNAAVNNSTKQEATGIPSDVHATDNVPNVSAEATKVSADASEADTDVIGADALFYDVPDETNISANADLDTVKTNYSTDTNLDSSSWASKLLTLKNGLNVQGTAEEIKVVFANGSKISAIGEDGQITLDEGNEFESIVTWVNEEGEQQDVEITIPITPDLGGLEGLQNKIISQLKDSGFTGDVESTAGAMVYQATLGLREEFNPSENLAELTTLVNNEQGNPIVLNVGQKGAKEVENEIDRIIEQNNKREIDLKVNLYIEEGNSLVADQYLTGEENRASIRANPTPYAIRMLALGKGLKYFSEGNIQDSPGIHNYIAALKEDISLITPSDLKILQDLTNIVNKTRVNGPFGIVTEGKDYFHWAEELFNLNK